MSGHSKWSNIKYKKGVEDARKSKSFGKLSKMIEVAARKGKDPQANPQLRLSIERARAFNMPNENIERAIKKGAGKLEGTELEEFTVEAYGPGGVALIIECLSDNKNRTLSQVRHILSQHQGTVADAGSVKWGFEQKPGPEGLEWIAKFPTEPDQKIKEALEKLYEALDEHDDVKDFYSNANF